MPFAYIYVACRLHIYTLNTKVTNSNLLKQAIIKPTLNLT